MNGIDLRAAVSGLLGTTGIHAAATVALLLSLSLTSRDPGWGDPLMMLDVHAPAVPPALFEIAPSRQEGRLQVVSGGPDCTRWMPDVLPVIASGDSLRDAVVLKRLPRLCVRVGVDGQVLAARVLRSSGDRVVDARIEQGARSLVFAPARQDGSAVPATVTLDVVAGRRPPRPAETVVDQPAFPLM